MTVLITWDIDDDEAEAYFDYAGYKTRRMTEPMRRVGNLVELLIGLQFITEGLTMSGGWRHLDPDYEDEKIGDGYFDGILHREGDLEEAATEHSSGYGAVSRGPVKVGNGWLTLDIERIVKDGTDIAAVHQTGRAPGGKHTHYMPARPLWETTQDFEAGVEVIFAEWLDELKRTNVRRRGKSLPRPGTIQPSYQLEPYLYG